ncbi:hypothetical protein CEXT_106591 [Caerostris extrusa]|uniref:Uncharacterized protein n=1 Tax=Caerostris extrusa TaxID=172846 RepID=A0AAV4TG77_CAEEX|nr:hypothetical protein CEXT_106591 [Caerostris extrusa]
MGNFRVDTENPRRHFCWCGIICGVICATGVILAAFFPPRGSNSCEDNGKVVLRLAEDLLFKAKGIHNFYSNKSRITDALQQDRPGLFRNLGGGP